LSTGATIISADCEGRVGLASVNVSPGAVATVRVTPSSITLMTGETLQLVAQPMDNANSPLSNRPVVWSTSSPSVATVTSAGVVTGVGSGSTTITATSEGRSGTVSVAVRQSAQPTLTVSPSSATIDRNKSIQLTAVFRDGDGRVVEKNFQWFTSDGDIATVSSKGKVSGKRPGVVTIRASASGISGSASVRVR
jgi:uncharacterized protein YjdB